MRGPPAAGAVPRGRAGGPRHPARRAPGAGAAARRGGVRGRAVAGRRRAARLHGRQGLRQAVGHHQPGRPQLTGASVAVGLLGE